MGKQAAAPLWSLLLFCLLSLGIYNKVMAELPSCSIPHPPSAEGWSPYGSLYLLQTQSLPKSHLEQKIEALGLVDIQQVEPSIVVQLMYGGVDNFVGENMYGTLLTRAYLQPHIAKKLQKAQTIIQERWGKEYSLIVYDAARPLSVQRRMWEQVRGTPHQAYVASPRNGGGRHNYGVAIDLSIIHTPTGTPVDMGSPVDHFGERAHIHKEAELLQRGLITPEAKANRAFLIAVMKEVGLRPIRKEWWHFEEPMSIQQVRTQYPLLDF